MLPLPPAPHWMLVAECRSSACAGQVCRWVGVACATIPAGAPNGRARRSSAAEPDSLAPDANELRVDAHDGFEELQSIDRQAKELTLVCPDAVA
jgi:hypothetical protein